LTCGVLASADVPGAVIRGEEIEREAVGTVRFAVGDAAATAAAGSLGVS
jgi:hypothetical protein